MDINLNAIPEKRKKIATPGLKGMDYLSQCKLREELGKEDTHFAEYVLKPATDEMWNLIDGKRNIQEIVEYSMLEFDLNIQSDCWLPVFAGWQKAGLIVTHSEVYQRRRGND
jgi:hypothetical protein